MDSVIITANCPECRKPTRCDLLHCKEVHQSDDSEMVSLWTKYNTMQCRGCETVFFQIDSVFSEDLDYVETTSGEYEPVPVHRYKYFPAPTRREPPEWAAELLAADRVISDFYDELYTALNSSLLVLSTIGVRTVLDRSFEILNITEQTFAKKLKKLHEEGFVGETERDLLSIVTEAGNAAAHRAWKPSVQQLDAIVDVLNQFLHRTFVLRHDLKPVKSAIPPKPRKSR